MQDSEFETLRRWATQLPGKRLRKVARLLDDPDDSPSDINRSFEPLLLVIEDEAPVFLTVDEGKGNLIIRDYGTVLANRPAVFGDYIPIDVDCQSLFDSSSLDSFGAINTVTALSLSDDELPPDYFIICGLKLTSKDGFAFSIGTHLTRMRLAGLWLVPIADVATTIRERELSSREC